MRVWADLLLEPRAAKYCQTTVRTAFCKAKVFGCIKDDFTQSDLLSPRWEIQPFLNYSSPSEIPNNAGYIHF